MKKFAGLVILVLLFSGVVAQELNVGSYNIRLSTKKDYQQNDGWDQRKAVLCNFIDYIDYDIFGAQEVKKGQLEYILKALPQYDYVGVGRDDGKTKGEYSPVFYKKDRFKLLDGGTFWLSLTPDVPSKGWDARYNRICSWGYFKDLKTKKKFYFFNLHMDHIGVEARRESSRQVVEHIRTKCGENANFILTGDFNVSQENEIFKIFTECGFMYNSFDVAKRRLTLSGTFNSFDVQRYTTKRIDHIWVSKSTDVEKFGILPFHYWLDKEGVPCSLVDAPKEIKGEKREVHIPSDHYPLQSFVSFK